MRKLITLPLGLLLLTSAAAQEPAIEPGKERWPIKSSVPQNTIAPRAAGTSQPKVVALSDLLVLGDPQPPVAKDDRRFQAALIPKFPNSLDVAEGDILTTTAWLHLVALETDGDYHIQVSASPDSGDHCLIVEVPDPNPQFVSSDSLCAQFQAVRTFIKTNLLRNNEPSPSGSVMIHQVFVRITGQLFYDDSHVGDPPRGKKGMHAATLWELHPVISISFEPPPAS